MTRRTGASARAKALARAVDAVARRDAERIAREKAVQATLAEFFQAQAEVERIQAEADRASAPCDATMRAAVLALDRLGETRTGISSLTGLALARVREYLAASVNPEVGNDSARRAEAPISGEPSRVGPASSP